jgi:hypothetical protein
MIFRDQCKLFFITLIIDIQYLVALYYSYLSVYDKLWISSLLILHILFYYGLFTVNRNLLDFLHYFVFIMPILALLIDNLYFKIITLFLITLIQFLWLSEERCILNEKNYIFGYGKEVSLLIILLTILLSANIGYTFSFL